MKMFYEKDTDVNLIKEKKYISYNNCYLWNPAGFTTDKITIGKTCSSA